MPAAAVIPAPIAYIKVVAVKTLVVEFLLCKQSFLMLIFVSDIFLALHHLTAVLFRNVTLSKLECFKQALCLEYSSME